MSTQANYTVSKVELNEQILFTANSGIFIGRIVGETEKALKVDYTFESVWGNGGITVFTRTMWMPKSVVINDEIGGLTVKPWFKDKAAYPEKVYHIKKYYVSKGQTIFV